MTIYIFNTRLPLIKPPATLYSFVHLVVCLRVLPALIIFFTGPLWFCLVLPAICTILHFHCSQLLLSIAVSTRQVFLFDRIFFFRFGGNCCYHRILLDTVGWKFYRWFVRDDKVCLFFLIFLVGRRESILVCRHVDSCVRAICSFY